MFCHVPKLFYLYLDRITLHVEKGFPVSNSTSYDIAEIICPEFTWTYHILRIHVSLNRKVKAFPVPYVYLILFPAILKSTFPISGLWKCKSRVPKMPYWTPLKKWKIYHTRAVNITTIPDMILWALLNLVFFYEKYWKCYFCLPPFPPNQCWECSRIPGGPTNAKKTASDLIQPTNRVK